MFLIIIINEQKSFPDKTNYYKQKKAIHLKIYMFWPLPSEPFNVNVAISNKNITHRLMFIVIISYIRPYS